ncbi:MAG: hypothetical protein PHC48_02550 [Prevotella sp.]|nr:hypothetical protein [Prevotella sp.]MDD3386943.1 hypothetical protein [Prevotella sp.]MDD4533337.1 hypothetical protein [Prevotella sp.]
MTYPQTRIARSRWMLPTVAIYAAIVCLAEGVVTQQLWLQIILLAVSTLMIAELNNANSLIRIYSRTVSSSFLIMTLMAIFLLPSIKVAVTQLTVICFFLFLFRAYQNSSATGWVFYAFCSLGITSIVFVQVLFFMPILWILMATNVLAFSARTFFASILGVIAPYWFVGAYMFFTNDLDFLPRHFIELAQLGPVFDLSILDEHRLITGAFILLLAIIGSVHFWIYSYLDKIRTRMIYEILIILDACCFVFIVLQPQHFDVLLAMNILITAPIIGHYLALSHTKVSNICFFIIIALALLITVYNLWIPSPIFS